ncbi:MAG: transcriptional regulator [Spirochaetes bacterium]|nr:MAG: transcriptional regulator [Spirochaetota bacterium]
MKENENAFVEERRQRILSLIKKNGRVTVKELSGIFKISEVSVRQDLNVLAALGRIIRTHGGAVYVAFDEPELSFPMRRQKQKKEKEAIGKAAADLIEDGEVIFLDASSTASFIPPFLEKRREVTVITNNIETAFRLNSLKQISVILTGGKVRKETLSLVDASLSCILPEGNISKAFFGAWGLSLKEGLTDVNSEEIAVKRAVLKRAKTVVVLLDSTKWGRVSFKTFAQINEVDAVITDNRAPAEIVNVLKGRDIRVITV